MADLRRALSRDVLFAAPLLLGCKLIRGEREAVIIEVEAYRGADDPGCHAFYGRTARTEVMFQTPGLAYVYFTYGVHWMLNVVAHEPGDAAAILIRAAMPLSGQPIMRSLRGRGKQELKDEALLSGPGKIAQAFEIDRRDYGLDLLDPNSELRIQPGIAVRSVVAGPRVGLGKGKGDDLPWRFASAEHINWISPPKNRWFA